MYDQRILDLLDMRIFTEADADLCLARRSKSMIVQRSIARKLLADAEIKQVTRDVKDRGRDIEGCIKQWIAYVKPNFERYVQPQRKCAGRVFDWQTRTLGQS